MAVSKVFLAIAVLFAVVSLSAAQGGYYGQGDYGRPGGFGGFGGGYNGYGNINNGYGGGGFNRPGGYGGYPSGGFSGGPGYFNLGFGRR